MKTDTPELPREDRSRRAFSLIEVVLAVGVVSFALLSIVAMVPVGLMSVHNAQVLQATGNITDQLRGQVQLLSFVPANTDSIQNLNNTTYYYTSDGMLTNAAGAYYNALITTGTAGLGTTAPVVDAKFNATNAQSILVTLTYPPGALNQTITFSFLVARQTDN